MVGPAVNINHFVLDEQSPSTTLERVAWWDQQQDIHKDILEKAAKLQKEVDEKRIQNRSGTPTTYALQSYVLVEYPKTMGDGRGRPLNKLQTNHIKGSHESGRY